MKTLYRMCLLGFLAISAAADPVINFDDISIPTPSSSIVPIPTGYHGLNWSGFGVLDGTDFFVSPSGYQAGVVSAKNVVYPTNGNFQVSVNGSLSGGLFDLLSAEVTSSLYDNLNLEVKGYINGTLVYDDNYSLSATTPKLIPFNYYGVTEVDFISTGGSPHPGYANGFDESFVIDNVNVTVYDPDVTPIPLAQNGGFEIGGFSNWVPSGSSGGNTVITAPSYARSGTNGAAFGAVGTLGFISQTLNTSPGQPYLVSFWLNKPSVNPPTNEFVAAWNDQTLIDLTNVNNTGWTNLHFVVLATGTQSTLKFGGRDDPDFLALDEISVRPIPLITNGGFETGDFTGWTQSGNLDSTFVTPISQFRSSGFYGAECGPPGTPGAISQTVPTIPGQTYLLSCWFNNPSGFAPSDFQISWNGTVMVDLTNWFAANFINPQILVTATATNTAVKFAFVDTPDFLALDEITAQPFPTPVMQSVSNSAGSIHFTYTTVPGFRYQVQYSTDLKTWTNLGSASVSEGATATASDDIGPNPHRFYRVSVLQPIFIF